MPINNEDLAAKLTKSVLAAKQAGVDPVDLVLANIAANDQNPDAYEDAKFSQYERFRQTRKQGTVKPESQPEVK